MALKPRHKRRIFWTIITVIATVLLASVLIPPFITLNSLKPMVEQSVHAQTDVPLKLNGDIHFSLVGGATIVAHDVDVPNTKIGSVLFSIPFHSFFNIKNAKLDGPVIVYDADIKIDKLTPAVFNHNIEIYNSNITFQGRQFHIVRADYTDGKFYGIIKCFGIPFSYIGESSPLISGSRYALPASVILLPSSVIYSLGTAFT